MFQKQQQKHELKELRMKYWAKVKAIILKQGQKDLDAWISDLKLKVLEL